MADYFMPQIIGFEYEKVDGWCCVIHNKYVCVYQESYHAPGAVTVLINMKTGILATTNV